MKKRALIGTIILSILAFGFCTNSESSSSSSPSPSDGNEISQNKEFNAYWYTGNAEITTYELEQARYGNVNPGKSVLIFVTEDFLVDKQVKKESTVSDEATSILKLNKIDRFTTGIYDYSMMLSTFTPIKRFDYPFALKTTFSSQDWCGQSFMQVNRRGEGYQVMLRSYFEAEGDKNVILDDGFLEDEIWTLARLEPLSLPQGELSIIPASHHLRLLHEPIREEQATAKMTIQVNADQTEQYVYTVDFESGRQLKLFIQTAFPHRIFGWEEKVKSGFGPNAKWLTTKATMDRSIKSSYWGMNGPENMVLRKDLGLD